MSDRGEKNSEFIIIKVCDEARHIERDFKCERKKLLSEMKYFESYLSGSNINDEIDISVHCDVHIFDWLIQYIHKEGHIPPKLDVNSVVSILISSEFLQMSRLVKQCLQFVHDNINDIISLPIDLNCIGDSLIVPLSSLFSLEDILKIKDPKDKLTSRFLMKHLETLLSEKEKNIVMCDYCNRIFPDYDLTRMNCYVSPPLISHTGKLVGYHKINKSWTVRSYLQTLRSKMKLPWKEIFWKIWGTTNTLYCIICQDRYTASEINQCMFHTLTPIFEEGANVGSYPCCSKIAYRFGERNIQSGCASRSHVFDSTREDVLLINLIKNAGMLICPPLALSDETPLEKKENNIPKPDKLTSKATKAQKFLQISEVNSQQPMQMNKSNSNEKNSKKYLSVPVFIDSKDASVDDSSSDDDHTPLKSSSASNNVSRLKTRKSPIVGHSSSSFFNLNRELPKGKKNIKDESTRESDTERMLALCQSLRSMRTIS